METAARIIFLGDSTAVLLDDLTWKHEDKDLQRSLNLLSDLILDDYAVSLGDKVIWLFEQMVESLQPKDSKLLYKIPPEPKGQIADG